MTPSFESIIKTIQRLPAPEIAKLRRWLDDAPSADTNGFPSKSGHQDQSLIWLNENRSKYAGQWVALDGDRFIAKGATARDVYEAAKSEHVEVPFVEFVTEEEVVPFVGGWLS